MPGPAPMPAQLKLLHGRADGRDSGGRAVATPPPFRRVPPRMPPGLSKTAQTVWKRIVPELARLELLKPSDAETLAVYCEAVITWREATKLIRRDGVVVESRTIRDGVETVRIVRNPATIVAEAAAKTIRAFAQEFGLTPSSEQRLANEAPEGGDDDENPFA